MTMPTGPERGDTPATAADGFADADACGCGAPGAGTSGTAGDPHGDHRAPPPWWRDRSLALPTASGALWLVGLALGWGGLDVAAIVAFSLGLAAGAATFVPGTIRRLARASGRSRLGVGLLMTIAALGAVLLGHVGEAAALAFLFSLAEALEERAMDRAQHGLRHLLELMPETARVARARGDVTIRAAEVREGDTLVVGAGERVATDGVVLDGRSWLDTSAITGESMPVEAGAGDEVRAGTINGPGTLRLRATADGTDNSLTTIVSLVEQAHARKGDRARLADRIARPLVPGVLIAAALIIAFGFLVGDPWTWVERALVVLVAASPCALAIAVPVTVISAIGAASRLGVAIKSGEAFEQLGIIRTVVFDKTGTLTRNEPRVVATRAVAASSEGEVLQLAAALEATSAHPLATAVTEAARHDATHATPVASEVAETPGHGLSGLIDGRRVRLGAPRWVPPGHLATDVASMAEAGMSVIVVEADERVIGAIGVRDELRAESAETVRELRRMGMHVVMLTGDNSRTAATLAREAGIDEVHADQLPADKESHVRRLSTTSGTAMIGDGINDAPALASATVGIAMGATGSAAAVESADVAFTGTDLRLLPRALAHAARARRIMTANVVMALAVVVALVPLALFGVLGLAAVVLIHEVTEVIVILNGVRAARIRPAARER